MTKFNDLKQLLQDSRLISEPIVEEGREFDPTTNNYFVPVDAIDYYDLEWNQIEFTNLGRRLTNYFDQLKADRRMLAQQMKTLIKNQELELNNQALEIKENLKRAYQKELKLLFERFQTEERCLRK